MRAKMWLGEHEGGKTLCPRFLALLSGVVQRSRMVLSRELMEPGGV